ncbi:cell division protein Fic (plasmid) [Vibrio sp. qd031]|uniref:Fic family protein n=1 Tax=Vibrio sp. qd031 TaxID=1603038 RepID=UPI000A104284|nr:Fic family protein [Vibrio sp. qd031]ORT52626.1 cell division protein Fic [Vibrio sp. qd031]
MQPPFTLNNQILSLVADISERLGKISVTHSYDIDLRLRRINQVRTIHGTLAIEGNELTEEQVTAILGGQRVLAPIKEVQEAKNAIAVYEQLPNWLPEIESNLLDAHKSLMIGMIDSAGQYRDSGVGVMKDGQVIHMAPPAQRVPTLMRDLFAWLESSDDHPLIKSCVFHYEFEFIHPFSDGNGRMGRLWQTLILSRWQPIFAMLPVENLIHQHQQQYYQAINQSTLETDSRAFIGFMLGMIRQALIELEQSNVRHVAPQESHQVSPQVNLLLNRISGEMSREQLQNACELKDRKSFTARYLKPALEADLIEMTQPDAPRSRSQRYRLTTLGQDVQQGFK